MQGLNFNWKSVNQKGNLWFCPKTRRNFETLGNKTIRHILMSFRHTWRMGRTRPIWTFLILSKKNRLNFVTLENKAICHTLISFVTRDECVGQDVPMPWLRRRERTCSWRPESEWSASASRRCCRRPISEIRFQCSFFSRSVNDYLYSIFKGNLLNSFSF